jgi:putative CocE/NonD family hydrolase
MRARRLLALVPWVVLAVCLTRVASQLVIASHTGSLPREEWASGLVPYPGLLVVEILVIVLVGKIGFDLFWRRGLFFVPRSRVGFWLLTFGSLYLAVMVLKYAIRMALYPHERWTGGSIPVFVHWLLAGAILLAGGYHRVRTRGDEQPAERSIIGRRVRLAGRVLGGLVVAVAIFAWIAYQLAPAVLARQLGIRRAEYAVHIQRGLEMETSDRVSLRADVFQPRGIAKTPTILVRINFAKSGTNTAIETLVGRLWAERGYTVVIQGTRGRYESGGSLEPFVTERRDGIETLAWVRKQPWFDGRLGMWGGSYFGYTQWAVADLLDPDSSALMIQIASTDFHGMFYPGGAFSLESALYWAARSSQNVDVTPAQKDLDKGYGGFPLVTADDRATGDVGFFDDWVNHAKRDAYWARVDGSGRARRLEAPALLMAGWYDPFLPTEIHDFETIRHEADPQVASATRLIIGPWGHARTVELPDGFTPRNYRLESLAPSVAWFDAQLMKHPPSSSPPVRIYVMGENTWRDESEWPLARTRFTSYYLRGDGRAKTATGAGMLARTPPALSERTDAFAYDPRNPVPTHGGAMLGQLSGIALQNAVETRSDVLVFTTPRLDADLEVTGPIRLILYVSTTAASTDFTGKLVDVHPDGRAYNVSDGILRVGTGTKTAVVAGRPTKIALELWPTRMLFRQGHRIRLEVSRSNYPRFDRNPNTGGNIATETHSVIAGQTVYHGSETRSRIILPVIPR